MTLTVTIDRAGRLVLPKTLRDEWQLEPGDSLRLDSEGDQATLRPVRFSSPLQREQGVWVFRGQRRLSAADTEETLQQIRSSRDLHNCGRL